MLRFLADDRADALHVRAIGGAVAERLGVSGDRCHRRLEIVRDVRQQRPHLVVSLPDALRHRCERTREAPDLIVAPDFDALAEVAVCHRLRRSVELHHRVRHLPREGERREQRERDRDQRRQSKIQGHTPSQALLMSSDFTARTMRNGSCRPFERNVDEAEMLGPAAIMLRARLFCAAIMRAPASPIASTTGSASASACKSNTPRPA